MKKIVFIGFCGKGFGDFLNSLNEQLQFFDICLEVIAFGAHEEFLSDKDCNFPFFDLQYLPSWNEPLGKAELWINLFPADLYFIWSGYHGIYANLRKYLHDLQIPYLLSEYTSVENLFFFDNGLHAEATIPLKKSIDNFQISFLESYIKPRYSKNNQAQEIEKEFLKSKNKKILFVGMWDDASGIKEPNSEKIQRKLSPYFKSSYEAANLIVNQLPENCILILKSHPHDSVEEKEKLKNLSNDETIFYIDSDVSIEELITISDLVITIASTVSILTAYLEKPLLLLGNTYLSSSNYSIKYDDKLSLKAQLISILEDFSLDGKARDSFFSSYLLDYETYSSDEVLNSFGVKSHNDLAIKCKMMIDKTYKFNFILNKEYYETISNLIKFSVEKHSLFLWQYERINEFLEKKINSKNKLSFDKQKTKEKKMINSVGIVIRIKDDIILLPRALESVANQSYNNWYLVIVNDGSMPNVVNEFVDPYKKQFGDRIQVIHNTISVGMEAASNIGLNLLDTDYAIIHDNNTWSPEFFSRMIKILIKEQQSLPNIQGIVCYTNRVIETVNGNLVTIEYTEPFNHWIPAGLISLDRMLFENMFPSVSFIFSLKICKELGGFNEMLPVLGDWDFHIRFLLKNDIWVLPESMAFYHYRPGNDGVLGNSLIAGLDKHRLYRSFLTNKWLRDDLNGNGNGLGIYCNQREHIEHLLRNSWGNNDRFREINDRFSEVKENIDDNKHKLNWLIHSTGPIEKFFSILRHFGITQGLKRIGRLLTSWK